MPDEVARIGALSNGSNGQRSLESASLHFERYCGRERGGGRAGARTRNPEPKAKDLWRESAAEILSAAPGSIQSEMAAYNSGLQSLKQGVRE
jgi:hypothetical protein